MDDSSATINEAIQLVEDRLASRVSIVFSHDFLEELPSAAQTYFNEEAEIQEQDNDADEEEDDQANNENSSASQHRCIKQMGKLTKVLRPYLESSMDVEILQKFIEITDENRPVLSK